jgi:outer membrane protein assembly factor BamB
VTAYALADGRLVWSTPMVPEGANGGGVIGPVTVDPGRSAVYVATGSPYEAVPGANPGTCSVGELDLRSGEIRWLDQVYAGDRRGFDFNSAPVLVGRLAVAANKDGFYGWDRTRRERLWHRRLTPAIPPGGDAADPTSGPEGGPVATDGRRVYVLSNDAAQHGCVAAALEARDGSVRWQRSLAAFSFAAPALVGGLLCVPSADGFLRALSAADGSIRSTTSLGAPSSAPPSAAAGAVVLGTGAEPFLPGDELVCVGAGRPGHRGST